MTYIKKLVIHGFKSFANRTEIPFDKEINVIIGPNGSGKSNISDALCFVLGRLSAKSMRASKSSNLIFQGTKAKKQSKEAFVDLVFDNSDKSFNINSNELHIKRIVKKSGVSTYKINNETKTRQEVLEILSQAGIDPNGFNIILQGGISRLVKMRPEERREIIEEVAGISIYEMRKQKSLHEIEKTEQRLKEVSAVLRERTGYLRNLEQERKQALKFKQLQMTIQQCKATIIKRKLEEKSKQVESINKDIIKNTTYRDKFRSEIGQINLEVGEKEKRMDEISDHIKKTTGFERDSLNDEVTDLNAQIAADSARKENFERKLEENKIRRKELLINIEQTKEELEELKKKSPIISKRQEELSKKKQELGKIEDERANFYAKQTEFNSLKDRVQDKEKLLQRTTSDSKFLFGQINSLAEDLTCESLDQCRSQIEELISKISSLELKLTKSRTENIDKEKSISVIDSNIQRYEKLKLNLPTQSICPLCQTSLSKEHTVKVIDESNKKIISLKEQITKINNSQKQIEINYTDLTKNLSSLKSTLTNKQSELIRLNQLSEKKQQMKKIMENEEHLKSEIIQLKQKQKSLGEKIKHGEQLEERYDKLFLEMQEISSRTDENLDTTILYKEHEIENINKVIKNIDRDQKEISQEVENHSTQLHQNKKELEKKQLAQEQLNKKFKKLYDERTQIQEKIRQLNALLINKQNALSRFDEVINQLKVNQAGIDASKESYEFELREFKDVKLISGPVQFLEQRLRKSENELAIIGSVNLRALETYDKIKVEYEKIYEKVTQLEKERDDILAIITAIDIKKKRTFMKTFKSINELFTENFFQLSPKGRAYLEIQNKEDIFEGGVDITLKIAKGKYFDVSSLSGGEQTLIALSLIFAIQKHNPYSFYILDEIDAALDKRNSELLANLLKKYMKSGQYIIISHNDSIISGSDTLYGVSMNNGISKIISLKLEDVDDIKKKD
ncbi:MAG: chromosome segregation SMC family protein [Nanoarchaeota archaeon]|nr:chromosome segregation SMC family protein [Nanoarchaeota archaeon]